MRNWNRHCVSVLVIAICALSYASCGDGNDATQRTQGDIQALSNHLIFTLVHEGHDGLTDEHDDFLDELSAAHDRLSDEHQALIQNFHDEELKARGLTTAHFLHELYYNPLDPEIAEIVNDPKYLEVEEALHDELGVPFDLAVATRASLQSSVPNVAGQVAPLISCTIVTVIIVGIVAGVVAGGIAAGTIITLAVINSSGARDFCTRCDTQAQNNCSMGTSSYRCDTKGAAETESSGETEKEKTSYKTHDSSNTGWVCTFQCAGQDS